MELELTELEADYILTMRDRHHRERKESSETMVKMIQALFEPEDKRIRTARMYERYRANELGNMMYNQRMELFQFIFERLVYRLKAQGWDEEEASHEAERLIETGEYLPSLPKGFGQFYSQP